MLPEHRSLLVLAIAIEGGLAVAAWLIGWFIGVPTWETITWDIRDLSIGLAASLPMLLLFAGCFRWPIGPLARIKEFGERVIYPLFAPLSLAELAFICLLAGIGEELFFRALLQGVMTDQLGALPALLIASAIFGLLHSITPTYALLAALMGIYLGSCWLMSGNLLVPVAAHGFYDLVALVCLVKWRAPPAEVIPTPPTEVDNPAPP